MIAPIEVGAGGATLIPDARFVLVGLPFGNITGGSVPMTEDEVNRMFPDAVCDAATCGGCADCDPTPVEAIIAWSIERFVDEAQREIAWLLKLLGKAIDKHDHLSIATLEARLGFDYEQRFGRVLPNVG